MTVERLITNNIDYANKIAKYRWEKLKGKYTLDEIKSEAYLGLIRAAEKFDENKNVTFKTFSNRHINGAISDKIRNDKQYNVRRGVKHDKPILSLNQTYENEGKEIEYINLVQATDTFNNLFQTNEIEVLLSILSVKERELIEMYYFQSLQQSEIAEILNISQTTVSRNIKKAIKKIQDNLPTTK